MLHKPLPSYIYTPFYTLACLMPLLLAAGRAPADIGMTLLAFAGVYVLITTPLQLWKKNADIIWVLVLGAYVVLIALLQSPSNPTYLNGIAWLRFPLAYVALRTLLQPDKNNGRFAFFATTIVLASLAVDTFWQYLSGVSLTGRVMYGDRLTGPLTNANIGNLMLKLLFPACGLAFLLLWDDAKRYRRYGVLALMVAVLALIPLTGERSTLVLALGGSFVFCGVLFLRQRAWRLKVCVAFALLLVLFAGLLATQSIVQTRSTQLVQQVGTFSSTVYGQLFKGGWLLFLQHPVVGIGIGQYQNACQPLLQAGELTYCDMHPHNFTLQLFTETGILGGLIFCALAVTCLGRAWQMRNAAPVGEGEALCYAGAVAGLAVLFFPVIITQGFFSNWPAALFWFSLALAMNALHALNTSESVE